MKGGGGGLRGEFGGKEERGLGDLSMNDGGRDLGKLAKEKKKILGLDIGYRRRKKRNEGEVNSSKEEKIERYKKNYWRQWAL